MTERHAQEVQDTRQYVFARARYKCESCGLYVNRYGTAQVAHRIPQTKRNILKYGKRVIHHPLNLAATCCLECNAAVDIRNHPIEIAALVKKIRRALGEE